MDTQTDIRGVLRRDHQATLASLDALRAEDDEGRSRARLRKARRGWVVHTLAEEAVVYRALEGVGLPSDQSGPATKRFRIHDLVDGMFEKLTQVPAGTAEWRARVKVVSEAISRHFSMVEIPLVDELCERFDDAKLDEMARQFELVRQKLNLLEEAKAA